MYVRASEHEDSENEREMDDGTERNARERERERRDTLDPPHHGAATQPSRRVL